MYSPINTFLKGLLAFLPIFLTVYCAYYFADWLNTITNRSIHWLAPGLPEVPGLGIVMGILAVYLLGVLVTSRLTHWIYKLVDSPLRHVPVVKDLYTSLKQLTSLLTPREKDQSGKVVGVKFPDHPMTMVGLLMRSDVSVLDDAIATDGMVAVYFPMSYQIGGYTVFVPREWVAVVDMSVEAAMRNALTGWMDEDSGKSPREPVRAKDRDRAVA